MLILIDACTKLQSKNRHRSTRAQFVVEVAYAIVVLHNCPKAGSSTFRQRIFFALSSVDEFFDAGPKIRSFIVRLLGAYGGEKCEQTKNWAMRIIVVVRA